MTCHILFVDDELDNLAVFEAACAERFPVLTASSAAQGLEVMRAHEVGVVLADQRMPGMTGLEMLERVQAEFPQTVRMLVTAYSDLSTAIDAINRGRVRWYLRKPWDHDELHTALAEALDVYQMAAKVCDIEKHLIETERVYSLGVITSRLAREFRKPVNGMRDKLERTRRILRATASTEGADSQNSNVVRARLLSADEELAEGLARLDRILDVVGRLELRAPANSEERADLTEVLRVTMRLMQSELRSSTSLELDVKPVPPVAGSAAKLSQVVLNLIVNALQAMERVPREKKVLSIRLVAEDGWARFEVADSGPGIPTEGLSQAFDPFSPAGRERGLSLGLAISKSIVEEVGGDISAENRAEGGTVFKVRLPTIVGRRDR